MIQARRRFMALLHLQTLQTITTLHQTISHLLDELVQTNNYQSALWQFNTGVAWFSDLQVGETETEIGLKIELCNVLADSLEVEVTATKVVIRGKQRSPSPEMAEYFNLEFYAGQFQGAFSLPASVQPDAVSTQVQGQTLTVKLLKAWRSPTWKKPEFFHSPMPNALR
jgi:HSP20 family molecular chaperone IbpA